MNRMGDWFRSEATERNLLWLALHAILAEISPDCCCINCDHHR